MTAPGGSIVTIQLTLDERTGVTLWAPPWTDEDGEEWQGFLGDGAKIIMFPNVDELFEFIATSDENDLSDHPGWDAITKLTPAQLRPVEDNRYDLEGVYEWAASDPDPATESSLANVVEMVLRIGEACEDGALRRLIGATPEYADLMNGDEGYTGREGAKAWSELGDVIADTWERALRRVAQWLEWRGDFPEAADHDDDEEDDDDEIDNVDDDDDDDGANVAVPTGSNARNTIARDSTARDSNARDTIARDSTARDINDNGADELNEVWERLDARPIELILPDDLVVLTVRAEFGDEVLFLGQDGEIKVFEEVEDLAEFCRTAKDHDLTRLEFWHDLRAADDDAFVPTTSDSFDLIDPSDAGAELLHELAEFLDLDADADFLDDDPIDRDAWDALVDEIASCLDEAD